MKYEKVSLFIPFVDPQYGTYLQMKVSADVILEEGDTPAQAWDMVKRDAEAWHRSHYGTVSASTTPSPVPAQTPVIQVKKTEDVIPLEQLIAEAPDFEALKSFYFLARNNDMEHLYDQRLKELNNG